MADRFKRVSRIDWIDAWKAILIVLVVAGHVVGTAAHFVPPCANGKYEAVFKIIYSFHMPAFFVLGGLLTSESSLSMSVVSRVWKLSRRLLVPYFFFGFVSAAVYAVAMPYFGGASAGATGHYEQFLGGGRWWHSWVSLLYGAPFPGTDGFRCNSVLWFLPCLFSVKLTASLLQRWFHRLRVIWLVIVALAIVFLGWACQFIAIPTLPYGVSHLLWYFPFFLAGYCLRQAFFDGFADTVLAKRVVRVSLGVLMLLTFGFMVYLIPDVYCSRRSLHWYLVAVLLGVSGSFLSAVVAIKIPARFSWVCFQLSVNSIGIMFLHKYIVLALMSSPMIKRFWQSEMLLVGLLSSLLMIIASTVISCVISSCVRRFAPWTIGAPSRVIC